jgi:hypothetical protein
MTNNYWYMFIVIDIINLWCFWGISQVHVAPPPFAHYLSMIFVFNFVHITIFGLGF